MDLETFLQKEKLSVSDLARRVDLAVPHVWRMVKGLTPVSDAFRWRFQQAFGVDAAQRVFGPLIQSQLSTPESQQPEMAVNGAEMGLEHV